VSDKIKADLKSEKLKEYDIYCLSNMECPIDIDLRELIPKDHTQYKFEWCFHLTNY
jgi:hypothetical protein